MLPPGHVAAGYLAAKVLLKVVPYKLTSAQKTGVLVFGAIAGAIPDIDMFYAFTKVKAITFNDGGKTNHRAFVTHAPIVWLVVTAIWFALAPDPYQKTLAIMLLIGTWLHFALDSIDYGIMWLWPFSTKVYSITGDREPFVNSSKNPFRFWWEFTKVYATKPTFYVEVAIIIIALTSAWRF
jgi:membrane-bound metal-dependent hydrolase YbcI (DUF457 family)